MTFSLEKAIPVLEHTPRVLEEMLNGIDEAWIQGNEGPDTFSPFDVLGHLIHGEKTDWTARTKIILESGPSRAFTPWDRFAQFRESEGKTLRQLLDEFAELREKNLEWLRSLAISETDLDKKGLHPGLGEVSLRNLLATWVVHDLTHIAQVARVMAKQLKPEMGPWPAYFRILDF
jgi:hypothetical protein